VNVAQPGRRLFAPVVVVGTIVSCALAAGVAATPERPSAPGPACGGTLWRLLTMSDTSATRVQLPRTQTTIAEIAKLTPPARIGLTRSTAFQQHVWRLEVVVDRYRMASNGEIALVLYSVETSQYMNAYLANPHCLSSKTRDRTGIIAARRSFTSHCPRATPTWQLLGASVDIAGPGFWNPSKATRGALPNGAELRPLTNFRLISGCGVTP
jgi:hypothetical protein